MNKLRDASNRLTFEFDEVEAQLYSKITPSVAKHFNLEPSNELVRGLDEIFQDYKSEQQIIGLGGCPRIETVARGCWFEVDFLMV